MSKHSTSALTMRDALYEAPGPKMRAKIRIGTAISLVAVAALVVLVLQRFYVTGQLSVHYWYFFTHLTTWKFLLAGFEGTVKVALTAGAIALVLGLALMLGRTSDIKPLQLVCRVLTDFFRARCSRRAGRDLSRGRQRRAARAGRGSPSARSLQS